LFSTARLGILIGGRRPPRHPDIDGIGTLFAFVALQSTTNAVTDDKDKSPIAQSSTILRVMVVSEGCRFFFRTMLL